MNCVFIGAENWFSKYMAKKQKQNYDCYDPGVIEAQGTVILLGCDSYVTELRMIDFFRIYYCSRNMYKVRKCILLEK